MMSSLLDFIAVLLVGICVLLPSVAAQSRNYWQCSATGSSGSRKNIPVSWTCGFGDQCCLTGTSDATPGCCKSFTNEAVFAQRINYISCSPFARQKYYCPSSRECCIIATSQGRNKTGCCISHTATDKPSTGSGSKGLDEQEESSSSGSLPVTSLALIIMVVVVVLIVGGGAIGMFCINSSRRLGRSRDGLGCYRAGFDDGDAEAAAVIGPPNYWETVEEASPENSGGPTETPASTSVPMTVSIPASQLDGSNPRVQVLTRAALPQYSRLPQNDEVALLSSAQTDDDNDKDTENSSDESEAPAYVP